MILTHGANSLKRGGGPLPTIYVGGEYYAYVEIEQPERIPSVTGFKFQMINRNLNLNVGSSILLNNEEFRGRYYLPSDRTIINDYLMNNHPDLYNDGWRCADFDIWEKITGNVCDFGFNSFQDKVKALKSTSGRWESVPNNSGATNLTGLSIEPFGGVFDGAGWHDGEQAAFWGNGWGEWIYGNNCGQDNYGESTSYLWLSMRLYRYV